MRTTFALVLFLLPFYKSLGQDVDNNLRIYNVTQFTVSKISDFTRTSSSYYPNITYYDANALGINMNFGYFVLPHYVAVGMSAGINTHFRPDFYLFPLGIDLRFLLFNKPSTPYLFYQLRGLVPLSQDYYKGKENGIGLGYKIKVAHGTFIALDIKYIQKSIKIEGDRSLDYLSIKGLDFSFGMIF